MLVCIRVLRCFVSIELNAHVHGMQKVTQLCISQRTRACVSGMGSLQCHQSVALRERGRLTMQNGLYKQRDA